MYGHSPARTSHVSSRDLPSADAEAHRFSHTGTRPGGGGSIEAPPAIGGEVVYTAGGVRIEARNVETGKRLWEIDPEDSVNTSPVLACGALYVSTYNKTLALNPEDGSILWRKDVGSYVGASASPVVVDDTLYIVGSQVTALDAESGDERWQVRTDHNPQGIAVTDRVYIGAGSNGNGYVAAFTRDGDDWWQTTEPGEVYAAPAVSDGTVFAASKNGTLTALDAADGSVEWQASIESGVHTPPSVADGRVVVEAGNGTRTMAFEETTGDRLWTFETGVSSGAPAIVGNRVLATGANTGIHALEAASGDRIHHWPMENVGSQPVVADGRIFYRGWNVSDAFMIGS